MTINIHEESAADIADYALVPIVFEVGQVLDVTTGTDAPGGFGLSKRSLGVPYLKDYDVSDGGPASWPRRFDLSKWGLFAAHVDNRRVGGVAVAFNDPAVAISEARIGLAVLWDIRVSPDHRTRGIGAALLQAAAAWAKARGCRTLEAETQNVNVPACEFYARHGFVLRSARRLAYPDLPDEMQLLWYKDLTPERG